MDSNLPVVLMSGDGPCEYRGLECLAKPFAPAELIERVSRAVREPEAEKGDESGVARAAPH